MERCPTCGARRTDNPFCHRCQTDLRQILAIERAAAVCRRHASVAIRDRRDDEARMLAERACALHRSPASLSVRATAALVEGRFDLALRLWRETRAPARGSPPQAPGSNASHRAAAK